MKSWSPAFALAAVLISLTVGVLIGRSGMTGGAIVEQSGRNAVLPPRPGSSGGDEREGRPSRGHKRSFKGKGSQPNVLSLESLFESLDEGDLFDDKSANWLELIRGGTYLASLPEAEIRGLLDHITETHGDKRSELHMIAGAVAMMRYAELNGPEAFEFLAAQEKSGSKVIDDDFATPMMVAFVDSNPVAAAKWMAEMRAKSNNLDEEMKKLVVDSRMGDAYEKSMSRHIGESDELSLDKMPDSTRDVYFKGLAAKAKSGEELHALLKDPHLTDNGRYEVMNKMAEHDLPAMVAWLEADPEQPGHTNLVRRAAAVMMQDSREEGIDWYMKQEVPDDQKANRLSMITQQNFAEGPEVAQEWLEQQADDEYRDDAEGLLVQRYGQKGDWSNAVSMLQELPEGKQRRDAIRRLKRNAGRQKGNDSLREAVESARLEEEFYPPKRN